jgi:hypothetical protein
MPHLLVRHKVSDFFKWKSAYDAHLPARKEAGLKEEHLLRNMENPNEVFLFFEVKDVEKAKEFGASANPVPIRNIEPRIRDGVRRFNQPRIASPPAQTASQMYPTYNIFLRSIRSARAPAGRINRKNGSVAAVDVRERSIVE